MTVYKNPVAEADTLNKFAVGVAGDGSIVILNAPLQADQARSKRIVEGAGLSAWPAVAPLSVSEALNLAAWLVAVTGRRFEFDGILDAIEAT